MAPNLTCTRSDLPARLVLTAVLVPVGMGFPRQVASQDHHRRFMRVVKYGYRAVV